MGNLLENHAADDIPDDSGQLGIHDYRLLYLGAKHCHVVYHDGIRRRRKCARTEFSDVLDVLHTGTVAGRNSYGYSGVIRVLPEKRQVRGMKE